MNSETVLKITVLWIWISMSQRCHSYSYPFSQPEPYLAEYRTPSSKHYENLPSTQGVNYEFSRKSQQRQQLYQAPDSNFINTDYYQAGSELGLDNKYPIRHASPCITWTSPEGIRFVLQRSPGDRAFQSFSNEDDCELPRSRTKYSPSYYSPGSASDLFYDYYDV